MHPSAYPHEYEFDIPADAAADVSAVLKRHSEGAEWCGPETDSDTSVPKSTAFHLTVKYDSANELPPAPTVKPFLMAKYIAPELLRHAYGDTNILYDFASALCEHGDPDSPSPKDAPMPFYIYTDAPTEPSAGSRYP